MNEATLYGGSTSNTASVTLKPSSTRSQTFYNGVLCTCTLFPYTIVRANQRGLWFHVVVRGAANVDLTDGTTTWTLIPGKVAKCFVTSTGWRVVQYTIGTARSVGNSTRASVASDSEDSAITSCFSGDPCTLAKYEGNTPLDGAGGRDLCILPFAQDVTSYAKNAAREPIRAADLVMPKIIVVQFNEDQFEPDPLHPLAATALPEAFYDALYNGGSPHALEYAGLLNGTTRHWHHARYVVSTPVWKLGSGSGAFSIRRHYWERVVQYSVGTSTFNVTIRLYAESTLSTDPSLVPTGSGPTQNADYGIWGTAFHIVVFCDQLSPTFIDGDSFTPHGWGSGTTFTKADPAVWGKAYGVTIADQTERGCHPQVVLLAHLPTTFQSPMGSAYVPVIDRDVSSLGITLKNRAYCYEVNNGAPWLVGGCATAPNGTGIKGNIVFGNDKCAAMTLGGGFPESKPLEFITWENGPGIGLTYLKPLNPGWDEICGELDVANGSSGSITICVSDQDGIKDGDGVSEWPEFEFIECDGHPDEPFEGVGGGHTCFNNNGAETNCCIATSFAQASTLEYCTKSTTYYDEDCALDLDMSVSCQVAGSYSKAYLLEFEDFTYNMGGSQTLRLISFVTYDRDPDVAIYSLTYAGSGTDWASSLGSYSFGATITGSGSASGAVKSFATYDPAGSTYRDFTLFAIGKRCRTDIHALGARSSLVTGRFKGYLAVAEYTSGTNGTMKIEYHDGAGAVAVLSTKSVTNFNSDSVEMTFKVLGSDLYFKWKIGSNSEESITAEHCLVDLGEPSVAAKSTGTVEFDGLVLTDVSYDYAEAFATLEQHRVEVSVVDKMRPGYGKCSGTTNSSCGTPPSCSCRTDSYTLVGDGGAVWNETGRDVLLPDQICEADGGWTGTSGDNPTHYGGPLPDPCQCKGRWCGASFTPACDQCPPPFVNVSVKFSSSCADDNALICGGISEWTYTPVVCA